MRGDTAEHDCQGSDHFTLESLEFAAHVVLPEAATESDARALHVTLNGPHHIERNGRHAAVSLGAAFGDDVRLD